MQQKMPVILWKHEFECREKQKKFSLEFSDNHESDAKKKSLTFQKKNCLPVLFILNDLLIRRVELVVAVKQKFENQAKSIQTAFFELSDCQEPNAMNTQKQLTGRYLLYKLFLCYSQPDERVTACRFEETRVWMSRKNKIEKVSIGDFGLWRFGCKAEKQGFFNWRLVHKCYVLDGYLDGANWTCSGWDENVWKSSEVEGKHTSDFPDCQDSNARNRPGQSFHRKKNI